MNEIQYTLLSDGPTDKALMPILTWLLHQHLPHRAVQREWADLRRLPHGTKTLHEKIRTAVDVFPCHLLFVHRDAEKESLWQRKGEIDDAIGIARQASDVPPTIAVIPIRMTEAWLLFDAQAIRNAAGNPNGSIKLDLPQLKELESIPDPKGILQRLVLRATELGTQRRARFKVNSAVQRIAEYIEDFSPLRCLSAFSALEQQLVETISQQGWNKASSL